MERYVTSVEPAGQAEQPYETEVVAPGVLACMSDAGPQLGAVEGEDFLICLDAGPTTPLAAGWRATLRRQFDKPVRYLVLSNHLQVRSGGAAAIAASTVVAHDAAGRLLKMRPDAIEPHWTFSHQVTFPLGGDRGDLVLTHLGRAHTEGDIVAWLPLRRVLYAGDLVQACDAPYTGDSYHSSWIATLDEVSLLDPAVLFGSCGSVSRGKTAVRQALRRTQHFLTVMVREVGDVHRNGGSLVDAYVAAHAALHEEYGSGPRFQRWMPLNVTRLWEELDGVEHPTPWTPARAREVRQLMGTP